jgi:hypothetical protein
MKTRLRLGIFLLSTALALGACGGGGADGGAGDGNDPPTAAATPLAPADLAATAFSETEVELTWIDRSDNEQGFRIERAEDVAGRPGAFLEVATTGAGAESYRDAGLVAGADHHYRVCSYNLAGDSEFVGAATATWAVTGGCECGPLPVPENPTVVVGDAAELAAAVQQANETGGDVTILLQDGTYSLDQLLYITADRVTIRGLSGDRDAVVVRGQGMQGGVPHVCLVRGGGFVLADLTIGWVANHGVQIQGEHDADGPLIHNVRFVDTGEQMLKVSYANGDPTGSDGGVVECCSFEYSSGFGPQYYIGGIDAHQARGWIVRDSFFSGIRSPESALAEHAIHFWSDSQDTLVERNRITDCDRGIGFGLGDRGHQGGIIRNNTVHTTRDVGIGLESAVSTLVHNNTLYTENYGNSIEYRFAATLGVAIVNNLANAAIRGRDGASAAAENNVTNAAAAWFVAPTDGDLHLAGWEASVVDRGQPLAGDTEDMDCETRPVGGGPDIGADEI